MKIFTAIQTQWGAFYDAVSKAINSKLGRDGNYGPSNIFGQILTVLNGMMQNLMLYIEDAFTEQNIYTAQRKKSIYSLARLSGYEPSLGSAARCSISLDYNEKASSVVDSVMIPNKTKIVSKQTGLTYNIILPQDMCIFDNKNTRHLTAVEGAFMAKDYVSSGGELYSINVNTPGDIDIDFFTVHVNGNKWGKVDCLYDMSADMCAYFITVSPGGGVDIVFGNGQFGRPLREGDVVHVEWLSHNGEMGNIKPNDNTEFLFISPLSTITGDEIDGNNIYKITLEDRTGVSSGAYSETTEKVRMMIGNNSRALVLADAKNYKIFLNRFSFVGYNRCWSEPGSLVVNILAMKDYKKLYTSGLDYFSLSDDDFSLSDSQKEAIKDSITTSGQQIGGTIINFIDPILKRYSVMVYLRMLPGTIYDQTVVTNQVRQLMGDFFGNVQSDIFIPKSDIIKLIQDNISGVDGVDIYFVSEDNEIAKREGKYEEEIRVFDPTTLTYKSTIISMVIGEGEDPHIGLDDHGNILLENDHYFPVIRGDFMVGNDNMGFTTTDVRVVFR